MSEKNAPEKKRRWYHNVADAYRISKRTYPWVAWALAGIWIGAICLALIVCALTHGNWILWSILGVFLGATSAMALLSFLVRRAMYAQIDGTVGSVYAVLSQIRTGWIIPEQPIQVTREQDVVWRIIGRPGIVYISEGPSSRVKDLLNQERRRASRVVKNVPIHIIQAGKGEGQVPLPKIQGRLRSLKKVLTKEEVPQVAARLAAVQSTALPIPKGVDPMKARPNRRAMRGQ
ncbi:DUF4191 domain-containing protein [Schaalia sp. ZJ405]|uniref:DUF4191 domain-containing protein n=1 Tax=unclassified Schaalia TaxID=2691889 RepID=UPI0013EC1B48|nr:MULTISPECIES: DUF4191 domain-containing protein [unclassified Schaalia]QPK82054.1 DUF4191 domain-containing protein [Schaalia sp. ZJ405]